MPDRSKHQASHEEMLATLTSPTMRFHMLMDQVLTRADPGKVPPERYIRLLQGGGTELEEFVHNVLALASGELVVHQDTGQVSINGQCFGPGHAST